MNRTASLLRKVVQTYRTAPTRSISSSNAPFDKELLNSFDTYNKMGAKFRVAVVNKCNMNCFFCHNEGMDNPRRPGDKIPLKKVGDESMPIENVIQLMNDFCELGGTQLNITGGEPLARKDICHVLRSVKKQNTRVVLNSNVLLADRLLNEPKIDTVDAIYASLHTTKEEDFKDHLGIGGGAKRVMQNMVLLAKHGYRVQINYSLGEFNKDQFGPVMDFALENDIDLKSITLIRSDEQKDQYGHEKVWTNPKWLEQALSSRNMESVGQREGFGGHVTVYKQRNGRFPHHKVEIKNVGKGRLVTDFCKSCEHASKCGEGIYAVRSGVDGIWKPCLLNKQKFEKIHDADETGYKRQILEVIHRMVGDWRNHQFVSGRPL
jgi:molybdenum cofactor biosynthesis enzyme MoaA